MSQETWLERLRREAKEARKAAKEAPERIKKEVEGYKAAIERSIGSNIPETTNNIQNIIRDAEKIKKIGLIAGIGVPTLAGVSLLAAHLMNNHMKDKLHKHASSDDDDTISYRLPKEHSTVGMLGTLGTAGIASGILNDFIARKCGSSGKARILAGLATGLPSVGALALAYRKLNKDNPPANTEKEYMDWLKANSEPDN